VVESPELLKAGAMLSFSVSASEQRRRYAAFVDKILRGAKPADLPIEQPTQFEFGINLEDAKALAITIPQSLLLRADEDQVIRVKNRRDAAVRSASVHRRQFDRPLLNTANFVNGRFFQAARTAWVGNGPSLRCDERLLRNCGR